jgi:hypothetical protein
MARIRTIKPEFFRHYDLFQAEKKSKLPLRLSFAGLWTAADREGRFQWHPEALKLDCLPYDKIDFSHVLNELAKYKFIVKYSQDGTEYGFIPSWNHHQVINSHEAKSRIPDPACACMCIDEQCTDGREKEKEKEKEGKGGARAKARATQTPESFPISDELKEWASKNVPTVDVDRETEKFLDHHRSKGDRFVDWPAAWRKWMRNAAEWGHARTTPPKPEPSKPKPGLPPGYEWQYDDQGKKIGMINHNPSV